VAFGESNLMNDVYEVLRAAFREMWEDVWTVAACNLIWLISQVLILPGPPATLALFYYGNQAARGEVVELKDFLRAMRQFWRTGWRWGIANYLLAGILIGDYLLTGRLSQSAAAQFVQGFYLAVLGLWLLLQLYTLPFLFEMEKPDVLAALRNGALMLGRNPGFSLALAALLLCILAIGTLLFMLSAAAGGVFLAFAGNHAVRNRLAAHRVAQVQE
jgi:uncharacterized membrane protein YesL